MSLNASLHAIKKARDANLVEYDCVVRNEYLILKTIYITITT